MKEGNISNAKKGAGEFQMNNVIKVLFLNLSDDNDEFSQDRISILEQIKVQPNITLQESISITDTKEKLRENLSDEIVLIVWVDRKSPDAWQELDDFMENEEEMYYVGFVVVFGFEEDNLHEKFNKALLRKVYPFPCPVNFSLIYAFIESLVSGQKDAKFLEEFRNNLCMQESLNSIAKETLRYLKHHPLIGYDRASISLVDRKSETGKRYLLKFDFQGKCHRVQNLQKDIKGDKLIESVDQKTVFIIEDLDLLRTELGQKSLKDCGWIDEDATKGIKSWIGFAAKHQSQTIAIITLDYETTDKKYEKSKHKLRKLLKDIGEIFADAVEIFYLKRKKSIIEEIFNAIGNSLTTNEIIRQILLKLKEELGCNSCTYFSVSYDRNDKDFSLSELISASNDPLKQSEEGKHKYKSGVGVVGSVLKEHKSILIPHAFEDVRFISTLRHPGDNVSMLAVPVISNSNEQSTIPRVIGVISFYREELDYFTLYDRDLIEDIILVTATVIERTNTLELSDKISLEMVTHVADTDIRNLLENICKYALEMTSAGSASIHLLEFIQTSKDYSSKDDHYRSTGEYYTFPFGIEDAPRLNTKNTGTTHVAIKENKTVEFVQKNGELHLINNEQKDVNSEVIVPFAANQREKELIKYKIVIPLKNNEEKKGLIGALYLNKYSEQPFSKIEKFALELFAKNAARIISDQKILAENHFLNEAHENFRKASESVASREDVDLLLRDVAEYSYSLVKTHLSYSASHGEKCESWNTNKDGEPKSTLADLICYVVISNMQGKQEVKAAWPVYELIDLKNNKKDGNKKGIIGLVVERREPIIIDDIHKDKEDETEEGKEYIVFKEETRSQMAIPILYDVTDKDSENKRVIGVINLEYSLPYAFNALHQKVIEHFARQVAIAFQKKRLHDQISSDNKILNSLHQSFSGFMSEAPQALLYKAVAQACEALDAKDFVVILKENNKPEIIPSRNNDLKDFLLDPSKELMERDGCTIFTNENIKIKINNSQKINNEKLGSLLEKDYSYGFCIPFTSGTKKIGFVGIFFSKNFHKDYLLQDIDISVYNVYINQIALAYENAKQVEQLKTKETKTLTDNIERDYSVIQQQVLKLFVTSLTFSFISFLLIVCGIGWQLTHDDSKNSLNNGGLAAIAGVVLQAVTVLAFNREKEANNRLDQYHKEIYNVGKLRILLSAAEQLIDSDLIKDEKQKIIQATTNPWLQSINEVKTADDVSKVNNTNK